MNKNTEPNLNIIEYPCIFPLKAIGRNEVDFEAFVVSIIREHVEFIAEHDVTSRPSNADKYLSVTVRFTAESREQLDCIYQALTDSGRILMLL